MTDTLNTDTLTNIRAAMPKNSVWPDETFDFDKGTYKPTIAVYGNHALGAYLSVEVTKLLGHRPERASGSTADVIPLLNMAAGLPVENDEWYDGFVFVGHDEIAALERVFAAGGFTVVRTERTNYIYLDAK